MNIPQTHTPAPWRVEIWTYQNKREELAIQNDSDAIAKISSLWREGDDSSAEEMANARLIAAAPDLLAHLKMLIIGICEGIDIPKDGAAITAAKEIISKIEGLI